MSIEEGNKLIGMFMELKPADNNLYWVVFMAGTENQYTDRSKLYYHNSWDWLMPVVEKIESLGGYVCIETVKIYSYHPGIIEKNLPVFNWEIIGKTGKPKIELTHQAVIEFIKWYNTTKTPAAI